MRRLGIPDECYRCPHVHFAGALGTLGRCKIPQFTVTLNNCRALAKFPRTLDQQVDVATDGAVLAHQKIYAGQRPKGQAYDTYVGQLTPAARLRLVVWFFRRVPQGGVYRRRAFYSGGYGP